MHRKPEKSPIYPPKSTLSSTNLSYQIQNAIFIYLWRRAIYEAVDDQVTSPPAYQLDEESVKTILNYLNTMQLIEVAENQPKLRPIIAHDFMMAKYRFHEKTITIHGGNEVALNIDRNQINVKGHTLALTILQHFGHLITKLRVTGKNYLIHKSINEHCWKSVQHLEFDGVSINLFMVWNNSFESITTLTIENPSDVVWDGLKPNKIFPNLKNLEISIDAIADLPFSTEKFTNLKHFKLKSTQSTDENSHLLQFLEENSQVLSLELEISVTFDMLHWINEKLPYLERLKLCSLSKHFYSHTAHCSSGSIRFLNVHELSLSINRVEHLNAECIPLTFEKLQSMELFSSNLTQQWVEFFKRHKQLQRISMPWIEPTYDDLRAVIDCNQSGLKEIGVQWTPTYGGEEATNGIVRIMHEIDSLRKVTIWMSYLRDFNWDFQAVIPTNWTAVDQKVVGMRRFISYLRLSP